MMLIGAIVCIAIIGAVVWLVMRSLKNKQATSLSQQQHPYQMNGQGYQTPPQQSTGTFQEGEMEYSYPQQQERPLD